MASTIPGDAFTCQHVGIGLPMNTILQHHYPYAPPPPLQTAQPTWVTVCAALHSGLVLFPQWQPPLAGERGPQQPDYTQSAPPLFNILCGCAGGCGELDLAATNTRSPRPQTQFVGRQ
jgi:hypothetical protein